MSRQRSPISREPHPDGFRYIADGKRVRSRAELDRIEALAIPPAWTNVEIARSRSAKILARGVDAAGRTQAIYHPAYRRKRNRAKFERLARFAAQLPVLRKHVAHDLARDGLGRETVVACVVALIDARLFRVGNARYARQHRSYGITTLRRKHVRVDRDSILFDFIGKSGKRQRTQLRHPVVARVIRRLSELPGREMFQYQDDDGSVCRIDSRQVNEYIRAYLGAEFTAKDFRTWGGTVAAVESLLEQTGRSERLATDVAAAERKAVRRAAAVLGNTASVTKSSYIDPRVFAAFEDGVTFATVAAAKPRMRPRAHFSVAEQCTLAVLQRA